MVEGKGGAISLEEDQTTSGGPAGRDGPRVYGLHGLRLRSAVPLAGFPLLGEAHDVDIQWDLGQPVPVDPSPGRLLVARVIEGTNLYFGVDDGDRFTLRVPGLCDFVIDYGLQTVHCRLDPAADHRLVAVLVSGLVVAFLLSMAGHVVLHASAVAVNGRALAFAGPSGTGKSTLAALVCGAGARLVTDDVLRLGMAPGAVCVGGAPQLRLRPRATWVLDGFAVAPGRSSTVDQRLAVTPPSVGDRPVPLDVIVLPRLCRSATTVEVAPTSGAHALLRLVAHGRIIGWQDSSVTAQQFHALAEVADDVVVVDAVIPWGPGFTSPIVAAMVALVREEHSR